MDFLKFKNGTVDLSHSLSPEDFVLDVVARHGIQGKVTALAFDPTQSLLAVGTEATAASPGTVYILGRDRIEVTFRLQPSPASTTLTSVNLLKFCDSRVVVLDSKYNLTIWNLETRSKLAWYSPPGKVTTVFTDPTLDWAFLGLENGDVVAYDLDRDVLSPFRVENLWKEYSASGAAGKARLSSPVLSLALHPKDIGQLLVGHAEGAVIFSLKQNKAVKFLRFELPAGAPGGNMVTERTDIHTVRYPRLSQALWSPTGTFILTTHEDIIVFWDAKEGRIIQSRTMEDSHVHLPRQHYIFDESSEVTTDPISKVVWCCGDNPEETSLSVIGGIPKHMVDRGITYIDLGLTPPYLTSTWAVLSEHFASPKKQRILPISTGVQAVDFCLLPKSSPHFAGCHDPMTVVLLLASGELETLRYPDGYPLSPLVLHPSLTFVHPSIYFFTVIPFNRQRWLGMTEKRQNKPVPLIEGGSPLTKPTRRYDTRTVLSTVHKDGMIRLWDITPSDDIENPEMIEIDLSKIFNSTILSDLRPTVISASGITAEFLVGMESGEVILYKWNKNLRNEPSAGFPEDCPFVDIKNKSDPSVKEGYMPIFLLKPPPWLQTPSVVAIKCSDVGFVAISYSSGNLSVVDLRGPTLIFNDNVSTLTKETKRSSLRKSQSTPNSKTEIATALEFSVLTLEDFEFSSIVLCVGTSFGKVASFNIIPAESGKGYKVHYVGVTNLENTVISVTPMNAETGSPAYASQQAVFGLREGNKVSGYLVAVTKSEARVFRPPSAKGTHVQLGTSGSGESSGSNKTEAIAANVVEYEDKQGRCLIIALSDGQIKLYSIPGLKEIIPTIPLSLSQHSSLLLANGISISDTGFLTVRTSQSSISQINLFGLSSHDIDTDPTPPLYNPDTPVPPRPTISNLQWLSGTQYLSPADLDILIGGDNRPLSKAQREALRQEAYEKRQAELAAKRAEANNPAASGASSGSGTAQGGLWAAMTKGFDERTKNLNLMGDSMDKLGETTTAFSDEVGKFVKEQKKKALLGGLKAKFF